VAVLHRRLRSRQRGSTFVERHGFPQAGPLLWVLPVFIRALRNTLPSSLADLSASARGVITTANRSAAVLSQSLTTPFADPLVGLKDRNLRDAESYTGKDFSRQSFACFIFPKVVYFSFPKNKSQVFCGKSKENRRKNYFQKIYRCKRLTAALIDVWTAVASSALLYG